MLSKFYADVRNSHDVITFHTQATLHLQQASSKALAFISFTVRLCPISLSLSRSRIGVVSSIGIGNALYALFEACIVVNLVIDTTTRNTATNLAIGMYTHTRMIAHTHYSHIRTRTRTRTRAHARTRHTHMARTHTHAHGTHMRTRTRTHAHAQPQINALLGTCSTHKQLRRKRQPKGSRMQHSRQTPPRWKLQCREGKRLNARPVEHASISSGCH